MQWGVLEFDQSNRSISKRIMKTRNWLVYIVDIIYSRLKYYFLSIPWSSSSRANFISTWNERQWLKKILNFKIRFLRLTCSCGWCKAHNLFSSRLNPSVLVPSGHPASRDLLLELWLEYLAHSECFPPSALKSNRKRSWVFDVGDLNMFWFLLFDVKYLFLLRIILNQTVSNLFCCIPLLYLILMWLILTLSLDPATCLSKKT